MSTTIAFDIDDELARDAQAVYGGMGLTTELAIRFFLQRTVAEGRIPFDPFAPIQGAATAPTSLEPAAAPRQPEPSKQAQRSTGKITFEMVECVWRAFSETHGTPGFDAQRLAEEISGDTGMSRGSAFIYLVILDNLVAGKPNTRNMKMKDLEYYMGRIQEELGEPSFGNACESLRQSVEYWDKPQFGKFAENVQGYLKSIGR